MTSRIPPIQCLLTFEALARLRSVTQATEVGTVYSVAELGAVGERARQLGLRVHMDGARFANAVAALGVAPKTLTWQAGIDVLCFGGAKNGLAIGEAVVFFDPELAREFDYRCKQAGQLASKMRFLAAPWLGLLRSGAWLKYGAHGNRMAERLHAAVASIPGVQILYPVQANAVFVRLPEAIIAALHEQGWWFYTFIGQGGCRFMCSWDTTEADVDAFATEIRHAMADHGS